MITIHDLAVHRHERAGNPPDPDQHAFTGQWYDDAGLPFLGGCQGCEATIAAYNAYPSQSGYLRCSDCIGAWGYDTVEEANHDIFEED